MGRPKKVELRNQQLNVRLTRAELNGLRARAAAAGMRLIDFGRSVLLSGPSAPMGQTQDLGSTSERLIYVQLRRLGNNLNQLVRHVHMTGGPMPESLEPLLRDIRQLLTRRGPR